MSEPSDQSEPEFQSGQCPTCGRWHHADQATYKTFIQVKALQHFRRFRQRRAP